MHMRRALIALRVLFGWLGVLLLALYVLSRVVTDRTYVTQYLFWTPWFVYALALACLGLLAWACGRRARRWRDRAHRTWTWRLPAVAIPIILLHVTLAEWHAWRYIVPVQRAPAEKTLRIMHWNMTYAVPYWWDRYIAAVLKAPRPDVLIVTNPTIRNDLPQLAEALGPDYKAVRCGVFAVFSRVPIQERAATLLGIPSTSGDTAAPPGMGGDSGEAPRTDFLPDWSPIPRMGSNVYDPGQTMYVRLDTTEQLGRPIVIWALDMPSQPRAWRMDFARAAKHRLDELAALPVGDPMHFPPPDIILGDCNTPRGSASLQLLSRGFPHAFDQAGRGRVATWPRAWAVFHIDHIFVGPGLRATSYRTMDLGISEHRSQSAEIVVK